MIKTRFAPSPTGYLHIGGVRTALYAWLYAKRHQGLFLLRIEDTDSARSTQASIESILEGMRWLGLESDEPIVYQTERFDRYREVLEKLLKEGQAYRCYCSKERLEELRAHQIAQHQKPRYDGHCRDLTEERNEPCVVRFKTPKSGAVTFKDEIHGFITVNNEELDDLVLTRTDGIPTYNFTVVVDDMDMEITHVIRGTDHINNTPRQLNILKALGGKPPIYAHVPMILGDDGKRLSKRHGAVNVLNYRDEGYLKEAMLNYLVRLGWSHGNQELFSVEEMIKLFDLSHVNKAAATFSQDKLLWLNQHYLKTCPADQIAPLLKDQFQSLNVKVSLDDKLSHIVLAQNERTKTLKEMAEKSVFFYQAPTQYDEKSAKKHLGEEAATLLETIKITFEQLEEWGKEPIHRAIEQTAEQMGLKMGKIAQPVRIAVTGGPVSPPMDVTLALLDKSEVLARIEKAIEFCKTL